MAIVDWSDGLTGRTRSFLVATVVVLLVGNAVALAAHDEQVPEQAAQQAVQGPEGGAADGAGAAQAGAEAAPTTVGGPSATVAPRSKASGGAAGPTTSTTVPTTTVSRPPPYTFELTFEPRCAAVGENFTLTYHVEPYSAVGSIATHADRQTHDTMWGTTADASGLVVHTWKAPPAPGPGRVLASATTSDGRSGGQMFEFRITAVTETC